MNRIYRMSEQEYQGLLQMASEQVGIGVYALEKDNYAELRCDRCKSIKMLKRISRSFRQQGFKVLCNGKRI